MVPVARVVRAYPRGVASYEARWCSILLAHWPVSKRRLASLVPCRLDTYGGEAFVTLLLCEVTGLRLRRVVTLPEVCTFPLVALRTYVNPEGLPGAYDLWCDVGGRMFASLWRALTGVQVTSAEAGLLRHDSSVYLSSERYGSNTSVRAHYVGRGAPNNSGRGSLSAFLTERYFHYTSDGHAWMRAEQYFRPWPLRRASVDLHIKGLLPRELSIAEPPSLVQYCDELQLSSWPREARRIRDGGGRAPSLFA